MSMNIIDNEYIKIGYDVIPLEGEEALPSMHVTVNSWSKDIMMREIWPAVLTACNHLKLRGYDYAYVFTSLDNSKLRKFTEMLGFTCYSEGGGKLIMRRPTTIGGAYG